MSIYLCLGSEEKQIPRLRSGDFLRLGESKSYDYIIINACFGNISGMIKYQYFCCRRIDKR